METKESEANDTLSKADVREGPARPPDESLVSLNPSESNSQTEGEVGTTSQNETTCNLSVSEDPATMVEPNKRNELSPKLSEERKSKNVHEECSKTTSQTEGKDFPSTEHKDDVEIEAADNIPSRELASALPSISHPESNHDQNRVTSVKCAGCGKVFHQVCSLPQQANRLILSLCDDCENITSALFVCISCGHECSSLAALRAHKQTHVIPEQRIFVCEMCGIGFNRQIDLEVHNCALDSSEVGKTIVENYKATRQNKEVAAEVSRSRRKPKTTQKVSVEAIVKSLTKRTQAISKKAPKTSIGPVTKKPAKSSQPTTRNRSTRKPAVPPVSKTGPSTRMKRIAPIKIVNMPLASRPKSERKVLKPPKVFECTECSEFFTDGKEFRKHKASHKNKEIYNCETCKKKFKSKGNLKRHELSHTGEQTNVCDVCNKKFQSPQTLFTHKKTVHNDEKPFVCDICHKDFKQLGNMKTHRRTHTGEKPFICKECGRAFAQMGNLQAHMVIHASSKPHVCEICGKSFSYLRSLQNHMRGTHTGERPFSCGICGKTFSNPSVLRDHKRTHSDKRGYLCDKCGKGFKSYKNLKQHEKFHLDVRPYSCQECGKGFVWFKSFQLHKRTHTGEKPYSCQHCDKAFSNTNSLKSHSQKHLAGYTPPASKSRSNAKASSAPAVPPPSLPALSTQAMLIPHSSLHQGSTRDHMVNSIHPHPQVVPPSSTSVSASLHSSIPPHSQAYGHVVFPQPFPSFVTNASTGGDFTIL